jgi:hypothetical protein
MMDMQRLLEKVIKRCGYRVAKLQRNYADPRSIAKAEEFVERYREIVADPLNLLIRRVPQSGYVDDTGCVILHNGHRVPVVGELAYYNDFSDILIINRGVHEPLEEFCFQSVLKKVQRSAPRMVELGAYWAHYSMWLLKEFPQASCVMVEPDAANIECGKNNFSINGYSGEFVQAFVGATGFQLDQFTNERGISELDILHSDIQGYELEMLEGARSFLSERRARYIFISTHSQVLHTAILEGLKGFGYRIEVSSGFDDHTTSFDGFVLASSPETEPVFSGFSPLGRLDIANAGPERLVEAITSYPR